MPCSLEASATTGQYRACSVHIGAAAHGICRSRGELRFENADTTLRAADWAYLPGTAQEVLPP